MEPEVLKCYLASRFLPTKWCHSSTTLTTLYGEGNSMALTTIYSRSSGWMIHSWEAYLRSSGLMVSLNVVCVFAINGAMICSRSSNWPLFSLKYAANCASSNKSSFSIFSCYSCSGLNVKDFFYWFKFLLALPTFSLALPQKNKIVAIIIVLGSMLSCIPINKLIWHQYFRYQFNFTILDFNFDTTAKTTSYK